MKGFRVGRVIAWRSPGTTIARNMAKAKAARRTPTAATKRGKVKSVRRKG